MESMQNDRNFNNLYQGKNNIRVRLILQYYTCVALDRYIENNSVF